MTQIRMQRAQQINALVNQSPLAEELFSAAFVPGTVYGVALNTPGDIDLALAEQAKTKPAPAAPVLFIKPRNTYLAHGSVLPLPTEVEAVEPCAALAVVFGSEVCNVSVAQALDHVLGFTLAIDISEAGAGYFRPPIREKCRDGFLPIGPRLVARDALSNPDALEVRLEINGKTVSSAQGRAMLRSIGQLISDVSAFMSFRPGDVLLAVLTSPSIRVGALDRVAVVADGFARLECSLAQEQPDV